MNTPVRRLGLVCGTLCALTALSTSSKDSRADGSEPITLECREYQCREPSRDDERCTVGTHSGFQVTIDVAGKRVRSNLMGGKDWLEAKVSDDSVDWSESFDMDKSWGLSSRVSVNRMTMHASEFRKPKEGTWYQLRDYNCSRLQKQF